METVDHHGRTTAYRLVEVDREATDEVGVETGVPTILYVHGSGGSHQVWANQYAPTGPAHPAVALDLSGHGESTDIDDGNAEDDVGNDVGDAEGSLDAYARDVIAVAEATDAAVLVGNSMGGAVALRVALDGAIDLDGLVLAGTGGALPVDETLLDLLANDFDGAIDLLHGEDVLFHDADEGMLDRSRATMRSAGRTVLRRDFLACDRFDVRDRLDEIDLPALAVVGEHDRLTPPKYHRELADEIPACEYREIPDAAHLAMLDRPAAFNDAIARFIATIR